MFARSTIIKKAFDMRKFVAYLRDNKPHGKHMDELKTKLYISRLQGLKNKEIAKYL